MHGFICERWLKVIECMLEKKPGVRQIHLMRIINLFEGCFNGQLKYYFNKGVMPNAEETGLSPDQWGGRNSRSAPACAMRKLLTWEYARYTKTTIAVVFFSNLEANFDNIIPAFTNILCQKKGMSKNVCKTRAGVMENLVRHVRTAMGTSTDAYKNDPGKPKLPGEGQGKADSMAAWTLISSAICKSTRSFAMELS